MVLGPFAYGPGVHPILKRWPEGLVILSNLTAQGAGEGVMNHRVMLSEATSS